MRPSYHRFGQENGVVCSFGVPGITEIVVEQMPLADQILTFQASGLSGAFRSPGPIGTSSDPMCSAS
jgi:hypothetical protein